MKRCIHCRLWRTRASYSTAAGRLTSSASRFQVRHAGGGTGSREGAEALLFTSRGCGKEEMLMALAGLVWAVLENIYGNPFFIIVKEIYKRELGFPKTPVSGRKARQWRAAQPRRHRPPGRTARRHPFRGKPC